MTDGWESKELRKLATVRVSNVDKKTEAGERPVRLCNYLDVYTHEYIDSRLDFMEASATAGETERFGLKRGDVIITKDSETPDDIGVPAVLTENVEGLVCGYHLALIRPDEEQVDPVFLAKQIGTSRVRRYFAVHASGSTRFGLAVSAIESVPILTPEKCEQTKIAEVLLSVDRAIEQTEAVIAKQERIKTGLIQDLLARGVDDNGDLRSEETHEFKDSALGRVPAEWDVRPMGSFVRIQHGFAFLGEFFADAGDDNVLLTPGNFHVEGGLYFTERNTKYYTGVFPEEFVLSNGDVVVVMTDLTKEMAILGKAAIVQRPHRLLHNQRIGKLHVDPKVEVDSGFLVLLMNSEAFRRNVKVTATGTTVRHTSPAKMLAPLVAMPSVEEQIRIRTFIDRADNRVESLSSELSKLQLLKTGLMQDLLTGKKRVTPLLEMEAAARA